MSNTSKTRNLKTSTKCGYCGAPRPDAEDTPRPGEVSTSLLTPTEIAIARAEGRLRVTVNGLGFVTVKASGADSADVRPADPITASRPAEAPKEPGTSSPRSPRLRSRGERRSVMYILKAGRIGWYATGFTTGVVASAAQRDAARWPSRKGAADARKRLIAAGTRGLGESPKDWRIVRLRPRVKG